jgi:dipeptidyl aminopeptidase/acylaminoacyl peptidase
VHGIEDKVVPVAQSEWMAAALRAQGVRCDLILVPGADHCFVGAENIGSLIDASIDFLDDVLKGPAALGPAA